MNYLISQYKKRLNRQEAHFSLIDHEDAIVATVFKVTQPDGTQLILKICSRSDDFLREAYFLQHFAGKLPVPRIIQLVQPETDVHGAILMERFPGNVLKIGDISDKLTYEIGSFLARIHLEQVKGYGDLTRPDHLSTDPRVHFTLKFKEGLEECNNHLPVALLGKCRQYYDQHVDLLSEVDGPHVIHRDFRPGNLIINKGKLQGIIDWSSARGGFSEEDFCPLEFGEWSTNPVNKNAFLAGYASIRKVPHYPRIMPLLRLSRAIATIGFTVKREIWESKGAKIYQFNRQYLESFLNKY
jgi:Ser/Thr protein kinase RdoA (MazF antagonist)